VGERVSVTVLGVDGTTRPSAASARALSRATLAVGAARHLESVVLPTGCRRLELGPLAPALAELRAHDGHAVVLASGDPGFFGILRALRASGIRPAVVPALSSVQRAFAAIGRSWDDAVVVSAHGRELGPALNLCRARSTVAVLTAPGAGPAEIGAGLAGWRRTLVVAEDLGGRDESISTVTPDEASLRTWREPNVVLCLRDTESVAPRGWLAGGEPWPPADGWALAESEFHHRDGMITKSEVRAVVLAHLAPRPGRLVWDLGAGSGSVGVECARMGAAVVAVERDPAQCVRVVANAGAHAVDVRVEEGAVADVVPNLPDPDCVFVGGGGAAAVELAAASTARRVVVALAALDRVAEARDVLVRSGFAVDGVQLSAARTVELPGGGLRLAATNPVLVLAGVR
jgi:precorrin-6Y C5,15-methyltransferase (decarboxylating)